MAGCPGAKKPIRANPKKRGGTPGAPAVERKLNQRLSSSYDFESLSAASMSASACFVADFSAVFAVTFGNRVWMDLPKLILFVPVPAGQVEPAAGAVPVMSALKHANGMFRLWLTCIAATHWPRFLKPAHASFKSVPFARRPFDCKRFVRWVSSLVFFVSTVLGELSAALFPPPDVEFAEPLAWSPLAPCIAAPVAPELPPPAPPP